MPLPSAGIESVINATGVIVHTNLGRAPWPAVVVAGVAALAGDHVLLEMDRANGRRGARARVAEDHLIALTGAEDALVTNNNAAAVALAVGLVGRGGVAVSRGELVEIGGGVRIPDIIRRAGAKLIEVGTTNRTRTFDFEASLADGRARAVLRVHPSNFTMSGFTESPDPVALADLAHAHGAIVIDDLGSGALLDTAAYGLAHEPMPRERLAAGADLVTFSGDKLVGGPQAGFIVGRADLVARIRRDPLARAMRPDKLTMAGVALTLGLYRAGRATAEIPVWRMIATPVACLAGAGRGGGGTDRGGGRGRGAAFHRGRGLAPRGDAPVGRGGAERRRSRVGDKAAGGPPARARRSSSAGSRTGGSCWTCGPWSRDVTTSSPRPSRRRWRRQSSPRRHDRADMTVVIGTAGHIDHGKTTLLRALTGIDADRLPEERRRGMTIDVGYAHLALDDGTAIDFVDVPGHDRLVGNMLVGAGEIDAAMLVVAADDGPRAQTLEHLALLDALGIVAGLVVVTKIDTVAPERVTEIIATARDLVATTSLAGSPVLAASGATGAGIGMVREALVALRDGVAFVGRPPTIAIDRVFSVKGRGVVVTGTLRGGPLGRGDRLRLVPGDEDVRIREIQVHGEGVARVEVGGRTALNLAGVDAARLHRGQVLTADPAVRATDRILVTFRAPVADRGRGRLHGGTAATDAAVGRSGRDDLTLPDGTTAGIVRLGEPVALRPGDRFVLRRGPTAASCGRDRPGHGAATGHLASPPDAGARGGPRGARGDGPAGAAWGAGRRRGRWRRARS
ncbi:MAG: L-seryl-tRNA(Sec) selenium transferase [Candidatus Limnocylindrales bacterium]